MFELSVYSLVCYGITTILVESYLFATIRAYLELFSPNFLGKLINCPLCTGFWVGIILFQLGLVLNIKVENDVLNHFLHGTLSSSTSYLLYTIQNRLYLTTKQVRDEIYMEIIADMEKLSVSNDEVATVGQQAETTV